MPKFFATCPKGLESLIVSELGALGAQHVKETVAGASFSGDFALAMRVCLWSRFATRVLWELSQFACRDDMDLYMGVYGVRWDDYFAPHKTIAVEFSGSSDAINNTQYGAQKVKDAVCDYFVNRKMSRPNVDRRDPQVLIYARLHHGQVSVGLDLSGKPLFMREFERETGKAPLKENLAAAMLVRSGYQGGNFFDPMCGSGTLLWEAGLLLTDTAPGLQRRHYGFFNFKNFDETRWQELIAEAQRRSAVGLAKAQQDGCKLCGCDADARMIELARENAERAGFASLVQLQCCKVENLTSDTIAEAKAPLTIVTNPPYGERMGNFNELIVLYTALGARLKALFGGARLGVISSSEDLLSCLRLKGERSYTLYNGALPCQLRVFTLEKRDTVSAADALPEIAPDFANRLLKNQTRLKKWVAAQGLNAYRLYDADIPEYNAAVDIYGDYVVLQEYQAPAAIAPGLARRRLMDMIAATVLTLHIPGRHLIVKSRQRQQGSAQYEKNAESLHVEVMVHEGDLTFKARLDDYLDSGIFFDARPIRALLRKEADGKDFLNLFAYTATASVAAAVGGASSTLSVDMSRTYLEWGLENFALNDIALGEKHEFLQADCLTYLSTDSDRKFDLIYIDPPTFSNSKRMSRSFEVQRDHVALLANLTRHLKDVGTVIFCCNKRGFKLNQEALAPYGFTQCENVSAATIPEDCARDQQIHACFKLSYSAAAQSAQPEPMVELKAIPRWSKLLGGSTAARPFGAKPSGRTSAPHQPSVAAWSEDTFQPGRSRNWGTERAASTNGRALPVAEDSVPFNRGRGRPLAERGRPLTNQSRVPRKRGKRHEDNDTWPRAPRRDGADLRTDGTALSERRRSFARRSNWDSDATVSQHRSERPFERRKPSGRRLERASTAQRAKGRVWGPDGIKEDVE